jgi:DNA primase
MAATGTARAAILKDITSLSSIIGERVALRRDGRYRGCCPFHDDNTPSFWVNDETGRYGCFGCNVSGDLIEFVMAAEGLDFSGALDRLEAGYTASRSISVVPAERRPTDTLRSAKKIWDGAESIVGTPAERYLASRALRLENLPDLRMLRFARLSFDGSAALHPALVAAVQTVQGQFAGVQRTYLTEDGGKLDPHNAKRSLGQIRGNSIQILDELADESHVYVCEGLEDGLSLARMNGAPVFVAAGAGMMPSLQLPARCERVTIGADNDAAGQRAAEEAATVFRRRGIQAFIDTPNWLHKDWNEHVQFYDARQGVQDFDPDFAWCRG